MEYFKKKKKDGIENSEPEGKAEGAAPTRESTMPKETVEAARKALHEVLVETSKAWAEVLPKVRKSASLKQQRKKSSFNPAAIFERVSLAVAMSSFLEAAGATGTKLSSRDVRAHRGKTGWHFFCKYCGELLTASRAATHIEECKKKQQLLKQLGLLSIYRIESREGPVYPDLVEVVDGVAVCMVCGAEVKSADHFKPGDGEYRCRLLDSIMRQIEVWREAATNGWYTKIQDDRLRISNSRQE